VNGVLVVRRVFVYSPVVEFSKAEGELLERGTLTVDNRYIIQLNTLGNNLFFIQNNAYFTQLLAARKDSV
jgi:hypothetical protein